MIIPNGEEAKGKAIVAGVSTKEREAIQKL